MKRILGILLAAGIISSLPVMGAEIDVSGMDFGTLSELKQTVDREYHSRPEAEPFTVTKGYYTVGQDLKPGRYFIAQVSPDEDGYGVRMHVYADKAQFDARPSGRYGEYVSDDYFVLGDDPKSMTLDDNNYLYIEGTLMFSADEFSPEEYYTYEIPEGTYVPAGVYLVGEAEDKDIPPGTYTAFPGTISGGDVKVYFEQDTYANDGSWHLGYDQHYDIRVTKGNSSESFMLEEGNVLLVEKDVVMRKGTGGAKLVFD